MPFDSSSSVNLFILIVLTGINAVAIHNHLRTVWYYIWNAKVRKIEYQTLKGLNMNNPGWVNEVSTTRGKQSITGGGASAKICWNSTSVCAADSNSRNDILRYIIKPQIGLKPRLNSILITHGINAVAIHIHLGFLSIHRHRSLFFYLYTDPFHL